MNKQNLHMFRTGFMLCIAALLMLSSCKKNKYYEDGGKANPKFNGTVLQYLESKPFYFDTIATIVKLAGMEKEFTKDTITFFAPTDYSIKRTILRLNQDLFLQGKDTVKTLQDIPGLIWRKYMSLYLYQGANTLKDYPQVDFTLKNRFPGQNYNSYADVVLNIGVNYGDAGGVKYVGYRQLNISYIPNTAQPNDNWSTTRVVSSDIQPDHAVVHVLDTQHLFSFDITNFFQDVRINR